ncbi:MAG: DUF4198 domain-containing protein [Pseudomonadota bacterium]
MTAETRTPVGLRRAGAAACLALLWLPAVSGAHQQWLAANFTFKEGASAWLSFDHTFGDVRFQPDSGPSSYYTWWIVGPDGVRRSVPHLFIGKTRTVGEVELTEPGTYRIEGVEDSMPWTRIKVDGEERWQPGTRANFADVEVVRSRVYFNRSVSYVSLQSKSRRTLAATGAPLEIVFDDHPNELSHGQPIRVRVLASGRAVEEHEVRVFAERSEGHDASATCTTDSRGSCVFELPSAGRYLLATSAEGDHPEGADTDGFSHGFSVQVEVR